jgi:hypothetical protein
MGVSIGIFEVITLVLGAAILLGIIFVLVRVLSKKS